MHGAATGLLAARKRPTRRGDPAAGSATSRTVAWSPVPSTPLAAGADMATGTVAVVHFPVGSSWTCALRATTSHDHASGDPTRTVRHGHSAQLLRRRRSTRPPATMAHPQHTGRATSPEPAGAASSQHRRPRGDQHIVRISDAQTKMSATRTTKIMMSATRSIWPCTQPRALCSNDRSGGSLRIHAWAASRTADLIPRASTRPFHKHETLLLGSPANSGFAAPPHRRLVKPISCHKDWTEEGGIGN